ncbi:unnamed protein product [Alopecurus aequalis]
MAASSTSRLNPAAPPFDPPHLCTSPPFALPMGCLLPPPPPPPCSFGSGLAPVGNACAEGASVFPPLPWLHVPPPAPSFCSPPSCPVPVYPSTVTAHCPPPPQLPLPATRCTITETADDGSEDSPKGEVEGEPSPRSVLTPWRRPDAASPKQTAKLPRPPSRVAVSSKPAFDPRSSKTSLMICNIPNCFTKRGLMRILDEHCATENNRLAVFRNRPVLRSEYDFLYLPVDFGTRFNKGYAFVNMTTAAAARRLHAFLHGHSWADMGSGKVCEVVHADIQGVEAFAAHFSGSQFPCGDGKKEFLPVRFGPPRDGLRPTAERIIGRAFIRPPKALM